MWRGMKILLATNEGSFYAKSHESAVAARKSEADKIETHRDTPQLRLRKTDRGNPVVEIGVRHGPFEIVPPTILNVQARTADRGGN
jgi:hypothetical protein